MKAVEKANWKVIKPRQIRGFGCIDQHQFMTRALQVELFALHSTVFHMDVEHVVEWVNQQRSLRLSRCTRPSKSGSGRTDSRFFHSEEP